MPCCRCREDAGWPPRGHLIELLQTRVVSGVVVFDATSMIELAHSPFKRKEVPTITSPVTASDSSLTNHRIGSTIAS